MSYVDYTFYAGTYGGTMTETDFTRAEAKAEALIRYFTHLNGDVFAKQDSTIQLAVCAAADVLHDYSAASGGGSGAKKSETNDGYSVTYVAEGHDGQTSEEIVRKKVYEEIRPYLLPGGWLSRRVPKGGGCCVCTDCPDCV